MVNFYRLKSFAFIFLLSFFGIANATIYPSNGINPITYSVNGSNYSVSTLPSAVCPGTVYAYDSTVSGGCVTADGTAYKIFTPPTCTNMNTQSVPGVITYSGGYGGQTPNWSDPTTYCPGGTSKNIYLVTAVITKTQSCPSNSSLVSSPSGYDGNTCGCSQGYIENNGSCVLANCPSGQVKKDVNTCITPTCATGVTYAPVDPFGKGISKISCSGNCVQKSWISSDGSSSVLSAVTGACDYNYQPPCPLGTSSSTVAGVSVCVSNSPTTPSPFTNPVATPGSSTNTTNTTVTAIDGSKTDNSQTTNTVCTASGVCTQTTSTVVNNYNSAGTLTGTTAGPTTTTTTTAEDFCKSNPTDPKCLSNQNANTDPGAAPATQSTTVDVSQNIDNSPRILGEMCMTPPSFTVMGASYTMDITRFCSFLSVVGYMMVAASSIICVRMITSGGSN